MKNWKDITQYSTAVISIASGIILSFIQYYEQGDLSNGVLAYVAQMLFYAGAIFGIAAHYGTKFDEIKDMIKNGSTNLVSSSSKNAV